MRVLAKFLISSELELVANEEQSPLQIESVNCEMQLFSSNKTIQENGTALDAYVFFDAEDLDSAQDKSTKLLAQFLSSLSYVTNCAFVFINLELIADWSPGLTKRDIHYFKRKPISHHITMRLENKFCATASGLLKNDVDEKAHQALRWYRLAIASANMEEQFSYFWFALEIATSVVKDKGKIKSKCPKCQNELWCENCGNHPEHKPFPAEAIRELIARTHSDGGEEISRTLAKIRNTLMHGGRIEQLSETLPCTAPQAINKMALVTWRAIRLMLNSGKEIEGQFFDFAYKEDLTHTFVTSKVHMRVGFTGDPDSPKIQELEKLDISLDILST